MKKNKVQNHSSIMCITNVKCYIHQHSVFIYNFFTFTANKQEKHTLLRMLSSVTTKWFEIGDLLGVDYNTIEGLHYSNYSDQVKMSKMLQSWLDNKPTPVTWDNIINVIEGPLQKESLAIDIHKFLMDRFRYTYICY